MARELIGDINNDGKINDLDLLLIFAKNTNIIQFNLNETNRGDTTDDGVVGLPDALKIQNHIIGKELITNTIVKV
jgi:hypothetical protein